MRSHAAVASPSAWAGRNLLRAGIRTRLEDSGYLFRIHPSETAAGLTDADITFGFLPLTPERYGALGDGVADDAPAFQVAADVSDAGKNESIHCMEAVYRLASQVNIHGGTAVIGRGSQGSNETCGTVLLQDHNNTCLLWDGDGAGFRGTGGGARNLLIVIATGRTGVSAIKLLAVDDDHRPGEMVFSNVLAYGLGTGKWAIPWHEDGTAADTAGSRGIRSVYYHKVRVASATTNNKYFHFDQATHRCGDIAMDTGNGTGTLGMTISGKWDHITLVVRAGNIVVDYSGADNPSLVLTGSCDSLDQNSTNVIGVATLKATTSVTNASKLFRVVSNLSDSVEAHVSATVGNVTGNATNYVLIPNTEVSDRNSCYDSATGIYTAKCAGRRQVSWAAVLTNLGAAHTTGEMLLIHRDSGGSTIASYSSKYNVGAMRDAANQCSMPPGSVCVEMAEGDTLRVQVTVSGSTQTVGVGGAASTKYSYLSVAA